MDHEHAMPGKSCLALRVWVCGDRQWFVLCVHVWLSGWECVDPTASIHCCQADHPPPSPSLSFMHRTLQRSTVCVRVCQVSTIDLELALLADQLICLSPLVCNQARNFPTFPLSPYCIPAAFSSVCVHISSVTIDLELCWLLLMTIHTSRVSHNTVIICWSRVQDPVGKLLHESNHVYPRWHSPDCMPHAWPMYAAALSLLSLSFL